MRCLALIVMLLLALLPVNAQESLPWPRVEDCAEAIDLEAVPSAVRDFAGVILGYQPTEGLRALRAEIGQPYYVAFDGSNFTAAAGISPDGAFAAFPHGSIQTLTASETVYSANELRIYTTGRVPEIRRRIAWQGRYPYLGLDGDAAIPRLRWLNASTVLYVQGSPADGYTAYTLQPFADDPVPQTSDLGRFAALSPDLTRGIAPDGDGWGLFDIESGALLARFEAHPAPLTRFVWSPDSSQFATVLVEGDVRALALFSRDGEHMETLMDYTRDESLWNLRWSPDGTRLAFSLYDPQDGVNRLHTADLAARELRNRCVSLYPLHDGGPYGIDPAGLVWSPDGQQLALNVAGSDVPLQILDLGANERYPISAYMGGLLAWGESES